MNLKTIIRECLKVAVVEDFGSLLPRTVVLENYNSEPGLVGDGGVRVDTEFWKISLIYNEKEKLQQDIRKLKKRLEDADCYSLPTVEISHDTMHRKWIAMMTIEEIGGQEDV